jgi:hypothetical protein
MASTRGKHKPNPLISQVRDSDSKSRVLYRQVTALIELLLFALLQGRYVPNTETYLSCTLNYLLTLSICFVSFGKEFYREQ